MVSCDIKQLLNEIEQDMRNYEDRGLCYLPKAEADNTIRGLQTTKKIVRIQGQSIYDEMSHKPKFGQLPSYELPTTGYDDFIFSP